MQHLQNSFFYYLSIYLVLILFIKLFKTAQLFKFAYKLKLNTL